jgi:hypothetical protein
LRNALVLTSRFGGFLAAAFFTAFFFTVFFLVFWHRAFRAGRQLFATTLPSCALDRVFRRV